MALEYLEFETAEFYRWVVDTRAAADYGPVISSAVDFQVKLVNDGYTQAHRSAATEALPTGRTGATRRSDSLTKQP